jgi:hypothetical protein
MAFQSFGTKPQINSSAKFFSGNQNDGSTTVPGSAGPFSFKVEVVSSLNHNPQIGSLEKALNKTRKVNNIDTEIDLNNEK